MAKRVFHFMRLPERILEANRAPTLIDDFYPKAIMDAIIDNKDYRLLDRFVEQGGLPNDES